jgi:hypothetical protein
MSSLDLQAVHAALRKTTEHFAAELAQPTPNPPDWSDFEWRIARATASLHGVSALLARSLRWPGPSGWAQFLEEQRVHTAARHQRMQDVLSTLGHRASLKGIPIVPLKGAALHAMGLYEAGTRPMADLDLLVRNEDHERASRMLEALGFERAFETAKHRVFTQQKAAIPAALGEHSDNCIKIELHHQGVWEPLPIHRVDITQAVLSPSVQPGLNSYPSLAALMTHLMLHSAGAMASHSVRMLQLHDIARIATRMTEADWTELGTPWWAWPPLALTARYFPGIPERVLVETAAACPRRLRRATQRDTLSDASLSSLWITALPGAVWARSLGEIFTYARQRVFLSSEDRMLVRMAAAEPYSKGTASSHRSRINRVLGVATSRQPRVVSLNVVRAALELPL